MRTDMEHATKLFAEMLNIHRAAKKLPIDDIERWALSIRLNEIADELREITLKCARPNRAPQ